MTTLLRPIVWVALALLCDQICLAEGVDSAKWEDASLAEIQRLTSLPSDQAIPALGEWLFKLSLESTTIGGERKWTVHSEAQKALIAIPGHAEWYRDDVLSRYELWDRTERQLGQMNEHWNHFVRYRRWDFETLKEMPSPETARVLGELLGEEENGYEHEQQPDYNLDFWAAGALSALGIETPPIPPGRPHNWREPDPSKLKAWRLWYGQVKAGNRTFRFEGDPTEYNLDGPVSAVARGGPRESGAAPCPTGPRPLPRVRWRGCRLSSRWRSWLSRHAGGCDRGGRGQRLVDEIHDFRTTGLAS